MACYTGDNGKENGNSSSVLGFYGDYGQENGNSSTVLGLYGDNGQENGNYHSLDYWNLLELLGSFGFSMWSLALGTPRSFKKKKRALM